MDSSEVVYRKIVINFISEWIKQKLENILWKGTSDMVEYCWSKLRITSSEEEPLMGSPQILVVGVSNLCVLGCALESWDVVVDQ